MSKIDPRHLDTAFVRPGTPTFAELLRRVAERPDLSPTRRRDLASGLRLMAEALGLPPEQVLADPRWLQPRLTRVAPAALGVTPKSWSNTRSNVRAALELFGITEGRINRPADLSPAWSPLWTAVLATKDRSIKPLLCRFVYFLNRLDVSPEDVTLEHALAYRDALARNEISKRPELLCRNAVHGWNLAVKRIPAWPRRRLVLPSRAKRIKLPLESFPSSFRADLERFTASLERPDPLDPEALPVPLRPASIQLYRREIVRFASALVHAGAPIEEIDGLAALVAPRRAELGLRWRLADNGGRRSPGIAKLAALLRDVAKRYVRVSEADQKAIDRLAGRLAVKRRHGMTPKNRERLRPLQDQATLRRLLSLSQRLFARGEANGDTHAAAVEREDAVAIAILTTCPIRRQNLTELHLEKNLHRPGDGRVFLVFREEEVKNARPIEFGLPSETVCMIDRHLATRSPRLCPPGTPWLFPLRDGSGPMAKDWLSTRIKKRIWKETGLTVNLHLFRHLAAMLWLDARPGEYEVARRLLGHRALSSTLDAYAGFEAGTATRLFAEVVDAARTKK